MTTANKAKGQMAEANRVAQQRAALAQQQVETYERQLADYAKKMREMQQANEPAQATAPPAAQNFSQRTEEDKRYRRSSARGSLLAGNTGGYNPATGGGRLGGRSLLG